jgi:hypothetical protein
MAHDSCVTIRGQLTYDEQAQITDWIVRSLKTRPADWLLDNYCCRDNRTGIEIWISNGRSSIHIWRPVETSRFHRKHQRRIWQAVHEHRHRAGNPAYLQLRAAMADAPLPLNGEVLPRERRPLLPRLLPWRREFPMPAALPAPNAVAVE